VASGNPATERDCVVVLLTVVVFVYVAITRNTWPVYYGLLGGVLAIVVLSGNYAAQAAAEGERFRYSMDGGESYMHPNKYGFFCSASSF